MGVYYYSSTRTKPSIANLGEKIEFFSKELFGKNTIVIKVDGVPIGRGDDRAGKWVVDDEYSVCLLRNGKLEFKVPNSMFDESFNKQQRLRRKLVRFYNKI